MRRQRNLLGPQGMGGMVSLWGASSLIASVQRGTITIPAAGTSATATITAVNMNNCSVRILGYKASSNAAPAPGPATVLPRLEFTNATTLTAFRNNADATYGKLVSYEVVEFVPGVVKSLQRGSITLTAVTSNTATITAVDVNKAMLSYLGNTNSYNVQGYDSVTGSFMVLTNGTTITVTIANGGYDLIMPYEAVEFF